MAKQYPDVLYTDDQGKTHRIRVTQQTVAAQTTAPPSGVSPTGRGSARVSSTRREIGLNARFVTAYISQTAGTGAGAITKKFFTRVPILLKADFDALSEGGTIVLSGTDYTISSKTGESYK